MANDEKEKLEKIPDVKVDDIKDPVNKPFFLVLQMKGNRKVYMSQQKIGIDRVAKIKSKPHPKNSVFLYDKRTKTIRLASERNFVLSNKMGKGLKIGHEAVFRRVLNSKVTEDQFVTIGSKVIHNKNKKCLEVKNGANKEEAPLQWWTCNGKPHQKIARVDKVKEKAKPDFFKQRFVITVNDKGNRNVFLSKEKLGPDFVLKLLKKPKSWRSWFIMDKRTGSIRLYTQRHLAISNRAGKNSKPGAPLVLRKYDPKDKSQDIVVNGARIQNKHSHKCLSTANHQNKDNINLTYWPCIGKETQKWTRNVVAGDYDELCKDEVKEGGKRWRVCPGKTDQFLGLECKRHVELKKGKEVLVKKCGDKTWEIAKCERFQEKTHWYVKCGDNYQKEVEDGGI